MKTRIHILPLTRQAYLGQLSDNSKEPSVAMPALLKALAQNHWQQNTNTKPIAAGAPGPANVLSPQMLAAGYLWSLAVGA